MFDFDDDHSSYLIAAAQLTALVFATRWLLATPKETAPAKKLHVDYGPEVDLPLPMKIIASLPDAIRIPLLVKSQAPTEPKDSIDILGTHEVVDPYEKREILTGKIWGVTYKFITDPNLAKFFEMFLEGTKEERQAETIGNAPDHLKETLKQDFVRMDKYDTLSEVEKAKLGGDMVQEMYVIKLDDGLILYNPVRMHPQMVDWIKERGEVKYIVSGSSAHTNHLPASAATFPKAKIICASVADMKCQSAGMRPANYLYDLRREDALPKKFEGRGTLQDAMESFSGNDVKMFHIWGDNFTDTMFLLAHGHLFVLDLIYSSSEEWKKHNDWDTDVSIIRSKSRIFAYSLVSEKVKPLGYQIPLYRCMFMDPSNLMASKMSLSPPQRDGSSCNKMAESLGTTLKELHQPGVCEYVHDCHAGSMKLSEFSTLIGQTWGWLDEKKFGGSH